MAVDVESENTNLLHFLYACPIGLVEFAADGTIGLMNPLAMQLLLPLARAPFMTNIFTVMEHYAPEVRNLVDGFKANSGTVCFNQRIFVTAAVKDAFMDAKVFSCTVVKLNNDRYSATIADISEQVAQERRLRQAETWFASLLDGVDHFAVLSLDSDGRIDGVDPSASRHNGFGKAEMLGQSLDIFNVTDDEEVSLSTSEQLALARRDGWHLSEGWSPRRDGGRYWCQRLIAVRNEEGAPHDRVISGFTVILREVKRQAFDTVKLRRMLTTDHLTGACNRAHFFEVGERDIAHSQRHHQPLSLIALDVDHFKRVNDTYGHGAGDLVLTALSQTCRGLVRPSDTFGRLGGEEFAVLMPSTDLDEAVEIAERLRSAVAKTPIEVSGRFVSVTISLGCSTTTKGPKNLAALLAAADMALYAAKREGRDRVMVAEASRAVA